MKLYILKNVFNIEKWDLGKECAYSSSFDDGLECCLYDITKYANNLGIPLTLYINPCSNPKYNTEYYKDYNKFTQNDKKKLKQLSDFGNEIASHTINHASLIQHPGIDFDEEIIKSKKIITDITNNHDITFCYPYGHIPENETVFNKIKSNYLGARAFNTGFNYNKFNFYKLNCIDIGGKNNNQLNNYVKESIKINDWLILSGHGIDNYGWNPINSSELYNHYNFINDNKNYIYIDTIANIIKYIKQRESLKYEVTTFTEYYVITIKIPNFNFELLPITFSSHLCLIYQNNKKLSTINKKNKFYFKTKDFNNPIFIYKNKVKKIVYSFWTGNNKLTKNRSEALESMKKNIGVQICLITCDNLDNFILKDYPLHPSYKYLSRVHKADYLRCYFMHHYGGGYSDIKRQKHSWEKYFDIINQEPNTWMIGLGNKEFGIAFPKEYTSKQREFLKSYHEKLVGVGFMICRPRTKYTTEWYNLLHKRLDYYSKKLHKYPAIYSREAHGQSLKFCNNEKDPELKKFKCSKEKTSYPISWNRILGQITYPLQVKYIKYIKNGLPSPDWNNYQ